MDQTQDTRHILFCSADRLIQKVIEKRLVDEGFEVSLASDGNAAAEAVAGKKFDLVVSEELLPFQSGFEIIKRCTKANIPTIIISDSDLENKILEAFEMGAYDFIDKPYSPNELVVRIKSIFIHKRS